MVGGTGHTLYLFHTQTHTHTHTHFLHLTPDSVDTPQAMRFMKELVTASNIYLSDQASSANVRLLQNIASYLTKILTVFGVIPGPTGLGFPVTSQASGDQVSSPGYQSLSLSLSLSLTHTHTHTHRRKQPCRSSICWPTSEERSEKELWRSKVRIIESVERGNGCQMAIC